MRISFPVAVKSVSVSMRNGLLGSVTIRTLHGIASGQSCLLARGSHVRSSSSLVVSGRQDEREFSSLTTDERCANRRIYDPSAIAIPLQ